MADATTVVEGKVKYREGKKWKSRWCVLKKPSPVADRLQLVFYKDVQEALKAGGKVKAAFSLDGYCGLESGFQVDREEHVLALLCLRQVTLLAFQAREDLVQFEVKIRRCLGQDYQYPVRLVKAPSGSRLPQEEGVKLVIHGTQLCLSAHTPPRILQCWNIADLRRYGVVDGMFCFDGGSRCGKGAGVHAMQTDQADEIVEILRVNSLGKPSRAASTFRSSQLLDYSQATGDCPPSLQDNPAGTPGSESGASALGENVSSPMLMCCQGLPAGDKQGCCKRHSVSITEFHRNSAFMFPEKFRLMPMEKQEHQHQTAVCDATPKYGHRAGNASCSNCLEAVSFPEKAVEGVSAAGSDWAASGRMMSSVQSSRVLCPLMVNGRGRGCPGRESGDALVVMVPPAQTRRVNSVAGMPRSLDTTVFDSMISAHVDITKRKEALQSLHTQETHLQQEMDLLDQMLQSCHPADSEAQTHAESAEHPAQLHRDGISTLEPPVRSTIPVDVSRKSSSLPPKISGKKESGDGCVSLSKKLNVLPAASEHVHQKESRPSTRCHVKPLYRPHSSAPLPYINMSNAAQIDKTVAAMYRGRDSESGSGIQRPRAFQNCLGGSLASGGNAAGVAPARCSSETRMVPERFLSQRSHLPPQKPLPLPPRHYLDGDEEEGLCISVEKLDDDVLLPPPTTHAPPVPYPRQITILPSTAASARFSPCPSFHASVAPPPPAREPIYANSAPPLLPPRSYRESPPALPPKGPGLLRRARMLSSGSGSSGSNRLPPPVPLRTRSLSVGSEGKYNDYDNPPEPEFASPLPAETKRGPAEDTYLAMGSPNNPFRRDPGQNRKEGQSSRPSSLCVTGSPKPRHKNLSSAGPRGNADVLSGYMDMANMFVPEPKLSLNSSWDSNKFRQEAEEPAEVHIAEPVLVSHTAQALPPESNYMEMSGLPPPAKRKSVVLKNLEALQTFVSSTSAGEPAPRTRSRSNTPVPPPAKSMTPTPTSSREKCKIYTRTGSCTSLASEASESFGLWAKQQSEASYQDSDGQRPAIPFTNLKNFEQKHTKPSYVNTSLQAPDVPLPEPPKKEEGFFARLIRRNSKEKSASQSQENLNAQKNRTSVFERTMSVHIQGHAGEEKSTSRLKLGRRRSASFPNRLSFQDTTDTDAGASKKDVPPPLPDKSSTPSKTGSSTKSVPATKPNPRLTSPASVCEPSMFQLGSHSDISDVSDRAPLLQRARSSSRNDMRVVTVLHVQQEPVVCPVTRVCTSGTQSTNTASCFTSAKLDSVLFPISSKNPFPSHCSRSDSSKTAAADTSKTDDEKLMELFECSKEQSVTCDIQEIKSKMILPLGHQVVCPMEETTKEANVRDDVPPVIPLKRKPSLLTPVSEVSSPGALSFTTPSPPTPPQHFASASRQEESIYVDMKGLLPRLPKCPAEVPGSCPKPPENLAQHPTAPPLQAAKGAAQLPPVSSSPQVPEPPLPPASSSQTPLTTPCSCAQEAEGSGSTQSVSAAAKEDEEGCCGAGQDGREDSVMVTRP
ncbi:LOW QUALITY PROTEIN: uncharacterized protein LOC143291866 [Babylonia areolata]|uniref:LOW QUALITY PROTEIN: uncharacterized protein LOC143291866 n=1 Tax=Babylonia areolata TaxID=304850 RepID=UPI003FD3BA69